MWWLCAHLVRVVLRLSGLILPNFSEWTLFLFLPGTLLIEIHAGLSIRIFRAAQ